MKTLKTVLVILLLAASMSQTSMAWGGKKNLKELSLSAPCIIIGTVMDVSCESGTYLHQKDFIYTYVKINSGKLLKGTVADQIIIKVPGGKIGDHIITGENSIKFINGEKVLLFLLPSDGSYYEVFSLSGKLSVFNIDNVEFFDCSLVKKDENSSFDPYAKNAAEDVIKSVEKYIAEEGGKNK